MPYVANQYPEALNYFLIRQPLVAIGQEDDAAILEAVFQDIVLHDAVVAVRVDADVPVVGKAKLHGALKMPCASGKLAMR